MARPGLQPIRQRQLIDATIVALHRHGLGEATVSRIGRVAGMSPAIVHHYFPDKDALLVATMRSLLGELRREVAARLARARTPAERLEAIVDGNFAPSQFRAETVAAWLCFWAAVPHSPSLARLERINAHRLRSNLRHALRPIVAAERVDPVALGVAAMIDGLFLRCAVGRGRDVSPEIARAVATAHLHAQIGPDRSAIPAGEATPT